MQLIQGYTPAVCHGYPLFDPDEEKHSGTEFPVYGNNATTRLKQGLQLWMPTPSAI